MAAPKKRVSRSRRNLRRAHHALEVPHPGTCSNCGAPTRTHHVCRVCGYYRGKQILQIRAKQSK